MPAACWTPSRPRPRRWPRRGVRACGRCPRSAGPRRRPSCSRPALAAHFGQGPGWLAWALFLACYAAGGWEPGRAGVRALRARTLDVDLLMVAAAVAAAAIGQVLDGGLLIVIFATSGALEAVAAHRTAQAVRGLLDLAPDQAVRLSDDGAEEVVEAAGLRIGDVVLVRPGSGSARTARSWTGPARSIRPRSPGSRCRWPRCPAMRCSPGP